MSKRKFRVWIDVEEVDAEGNKVGDSTVRPFWESRVFDSEKKALKFATELHARAQDVEEWMR